MKFGKEMSWQMVPEWQEAYMNYNHLKSLLKNIQRANSPRINKKFPPTKPLLFRAFSGLLQRHDRPSKCPKEGGGGDIEEQVIVVNKRQQESEDAYDYYETMFLMVADRGGDAELLFFRKLDEEFNKVDRFYREKVEEVMKEAEFLNKQMDALIAFRIKVENPETWFDWGTEMSTVLLGDTSSTSVAEIPVTGARTATTGNVTIDLTEEIGEIRAYELDNSMVASTSNNGNCSSTDEERMKGAKVIRPAPVEILNHVKMNNTPETPVMTIKGILKVGKNKNLSFSKENLTKIEHQLKHALIEFYQKLQHLKNYSFLNLLAFSKIMKKYDKVTSRRASRSYLNMVHNSYLGNSIDVTNLIERVEATFIKHFSNSNRSKGMDTLRPKSKKERHQTTFSLGLFTGCAFALLVALIMIIQLKKIFKKDGFGKYMETMFPLYSLFGFVVLHMIIYAINIYLWRRFRVNYPFIFDFKQGTELGYREVFLLSTGLAVLALASVLANLDMEMDERTNDYKAYTELVPLGLVILLLLTTFCPFNIMYRSSRFFLLRCIFRCICAPLYKVKFADLFLADQLTSQIQALRSIEFYICYYGWGDFKLRQNTCNSKSVYNTFYFIVAALPYWCRLLQCIRVLLEEKDSMQGYNGLKYLSTVVAVLTRTAYSLQNGKRWWFIAITASGIATILNTHWDIVVDWGLLQCNSKNRFLRNKLLVSHKSIYFMFMVLNILLRLAWLQTVLNFELSFLHRESLIAIVASLEIIRRGIWNFFRLENEHLINVEKCRASKSVRLPFDYDE